MKIFVCFILAALSSYQIHASGTGTHGGKHMQDRFLLAQEFGQQVLKSSACRTVFTDEQCAKMAFKLFSSPLGWHTNPICLKAMVQGVEQCVTAKTTPEYNSVILIDLPAAEKANVTFQEAVVLIVHEAGHSVGLSEALITDQRIIQILPKDLIQNSNDTSSQLNLDLSWVHGASTSLPFCLALQEALAKVYDVEATGQSGAFIKAWDFAANIKKEHNSFLTEILRSIGEDGKKEILDFFIELNRSNETEDYRRQAQFSKLARKYTATLEAGLLSNNLLLPYGTSIEETTDTHKHGVHIIVDQKSIRFEVCTVHFENTNLVNSTRFHECSNLSAAFFIHDGKSNLLLARQQFGDGGSYKNFIMNGKAFHLWAFPKRDRWVLNQLGFQCEKQLKAAGLAIKPQEIK